MALAFRLWFGSAGLVALGWVVAHWAVGYALRRRKLLAVGSTAPLSSPAPRLSVVVAARDEQRNIEACALSLLAQDYPDLEIIIADDRSTDATPAILERLSAAAAGRLRVVRIAELPPGWTGKNNALRVGVQHAAGEYLCFVDADCRQVSPQSLSTAIAYAIKHRVDLLSINPMLLMPTAWERILQPVCAAVLLVWFPQHKVNKKSKAAAYANGQFLLIRREAYEALGGHERVRMQVNEDIHLARLTKELTLRLRIVDGVGLYETRMYPTPGDAWRGWSRIFFGSIGAPWKLLVSAIGLGLSGPAAWLSLLAALLGMSFATGPTHAAWTLAAAAWGTAVLLMHLTVIRLYRTFHLGIRWSLGYPLAAGVSMMMMFAASLKAVGASSTTWRGTTYRGGRAVGGA